MDPDIICDTGVVCCTTCSLFCVLWETGFLQLCVYRSRKPHVAPFGMPWMRSCDIGKLFTISPLVRWCSVA